MLAAHASEFRNPRTGRMLELRAEQVIGDRVVSGALVGDGDEFKITRSIPRFVASRNYAASFSYQWRQFPTAQLDSRAPWDHVSERRLFDETTWPPDLAGQRVLEAGAGMGRFTEVLAGTGARVMAFDYSEAIEANGENNERHPNVSLAQADIYEPPYEQASFDKILCLGTLQHCPSPSRAFRSLVQFLRPGGEIVVDVYRLDWRVFLQGKYYVRPLTRLLPAALVHRLVRMHVSWVFPLAGWLQRWLPRRGRSLSWALAVPDYRGSLPVDERKARELAELDSLDMLTPRFDRPQSLSEVNRWFAGAGLQEIQVLVGGPGIVGRGRRPPVSDTTCAS